MWRIEYVRPQCGPQGRVQKVLRESWALADADIDNHVARIVGDRIIAVERDLCDLPPGFDLEQLEGIDDGVYVGGGDVVPAPANGL